MVVAKEIHAVNKGIKSSVYKLNLVCGLIRGLSVEKARIQLAFCKKRVAFDVKKTLMSAVANAQNNNGCDIDSLYIDRIILGKGKVLKRMRPRARGRGYRVLKHYSNLKVVLVVR